MSIPPFPNHPPRQYASAGQCIYCGVAEGLSDEHIIPFAMGGRWIIPNASCSNCAKATARFEGVCMRSCLGPFRMYFDFPSRRKGDRPSKIPLKVKFSPDQDWQLFEVERDEYPFLIGLPIFDMPELLGGPLRTGRRDAATRQIWIRSPSFGEGLEKHLAHLTRKYGFQSIFPEAEVRVPEFVLMLAKIAHSYAVAEVGLHNLIPYLSEIIRNEDTSEVVSLVGGKSESEPRTGNLHDVSLISDTNQLVVVRIRLLAHFEGVTYFVVAGRYRPTA